MATASESLLQSPSARRRDYRAVQRSYQWSSRSVNPQYKQRHRLDDATRLDCSSFNVFRYQNYPNRAGTPRRSPGRRKSPLKKTDVSHGAASRQDMARSEASPRRDSPLRSAHPVIVRAQAGRVSAVINDYHVRETNPGFARNKMGGFYMR